MVSTKKLVNCDCKVYCKLKCAFTIINYDHKTFVVQAAPHFKIVRFYHNVSWFER